VLSVEVVPSESALTVITPPRLPITGENPKIMAKISKKLITLLPFLQFLLNCLSISVLTSLLPLDENTILNVLGFHQSTKAFFSLHILRSRAREYSERRPK
jgi:hypothetical protein